MLITVPSLALGVVLALLVGALFHLFLGGGPGRLLLYLGLALAGFALGQWIGYLGNWILFPIGTLNLGMELIGSLVLLVAGYWVSLVKIHPDNNGNDGI
jgi:hypothetical protein